MIAFIQLMALEWSWPRYNNYGNMVRASDTILTFPNLFTSTFYCIKYFIS